MNKTLDSSSLAAPQGNVLGERVRKYYVVIVFAIIMVIDIIVTAVIGGAGSIDDNLLAILDTAAFIGLIACGQMLAILTGGIDLSVSSIMAVGFVFAKMSTVDWGLPVGVAILISIAMCMLCGFINGLMIAKTRIPPFMVTLGTMLFFLSFAQTLLGAGSLNFELEQAAIYGFLGIKDGDFLQGNLPMVVWLIIAGIMWFVLQKTRFGQNIYAVGGKERAAKLSGINPQRIKIMVYTLGGFFCAICALLLGIKLTQLNPNSGERYLLQSIAAVVVGGTNIMGGEGMPIGTILGAIIIAAIFSVLNILGVDTYMQDMTKGIVLLFFVFLMSRLSKR